MQDKLKNVPTLFVQAFLVTTAVVLSVVAVTRIVSPIPFSINQTTTQKDAAFMATGESSISTVPDKAEITIGISRKETDIKQAQSRANDTINKITEELQKLGIPKDDIKTQNYSIYPNYDYQTGGQNLIGYSVDISLLVSTKNFENLNKIVDLATQLGANQIGGIQFTLSEELEKTVKKEAREKAIEDAKANAQELARLSGVKLGRVINVTEGTSQPEFPGPMYAQRDAAGGGAGAPTNIEPGSTLYSYTVTLSYETN